MAQCIEIMDPVWASRVCGLGQVLFVGASTHAGGKRSLMDLPGALGHVTGLMAGECFPGGTWELPGEQRGCAGRDSVCQGVSSEWTPPSTSLSSTVSPKDNTLNLGVNWQTGAQQPQGTQQAQGKGSGE